MKNENGFSLFVMVITIVVMIILAVILVKPNSNLLDDSAKTKEQSESREDEERINEVLTYENAGLYDMIDTDIELMRVQLSNSVKVKYSGEYYGNNCYLYIGKNDVSKVANALEISDYYKPFNGISKSYVVDLSSSPEKLIRLEKGFEIVH